MNIYCILSNIVFACSKINYISIVNSNAFEPPIEFERIQIFCIKTFIFRSTFESLTYTDYPSIKSEIVILATNRLELLRIWYSGSHWDISYQMQIKINCNNNNQLIEHNLISNATPNHKMFQNQFSSGVSIWSPFDSNVA